MVKESTTYNCNFQRYNLTFDSCYKVFQDVFRSFSTPATAAETTPAQPQNAGMNELHAELLTADGDLEAVSICATIALSPFLMTSYGQKLAGIRTLLLFLYGTTIPRQAQVPIILMTFLP